MAAYGVPELNIARVVGIDAKTLRKHYREELDTGQTKATAKVAESLYRKATTDGHQSVTAAIFWLKTRGGWRETPQAHEIGHYDLGNWSDEELARVLDLLRLSMARNEESADVPARLSPAVIAHQR